MPRRVALGGPSDLLRVVRANGREPGPRSYWIGAWVLKSGWGGLQTFLRECAAAGDTPLILFWWWGDDISPAAIRDGVMDRHQRVHKTRAQALDAATRICQLAKDAGGEAPVVVLEPEFNKGGCEASQDFASYFTDAAAALRSVRRDARVVFPPGSWGNLTALARYYKEQVEDCDLLGLQALAATPRMSLTLYRAEVPDLVKSMAALRGAGGRLGSMPAVLYDVGFSTYGGPAAATTHPFAGGDGRALEAEQAAAIEALRAAIPGLGVEAVVYRDLDDSPTFALSNHFGHGERWWGVQRSDGSPKPGLQKLLAIASPASGGQDTAALKAAQDRVADLENRLRGVRQAAGQA